MSCSAYPLASYLADGIGRRYTIILGAVIVLAATAIQTASTSVGMFIGARCVPTVTDFLKETN